MALTTDQPTVELGDIDLLDRDAFVERVPHEWFATLRQQAPAYLHPEPNGPGFWVFTPARGRHAPQPRLADRLVRRAARRGRHARGARRRSSASSASR